MNNMETPKIVIIGGSYSSAAVFYYLQNYLLKSRQPFDVLLISEKNYYCFKALLSQYLCNNCDLSDISQEFRKIGLLRPGISYLETKVLDVDFSSNIVVTSVGNIPYTYLVLALDYDLNDCETLSNGNNCFKINSPLDALKVKAHIVKSLESAVNAKDIEVKKYYLTVSVIGSKKRGIEIACSIYDFIRDMLRKQFLELQKNLLKVNIIEEKSIIGVNRDPIFNSHVFYNLSKKNITFYSNSKITRIDGQKIIINDEKEIPSGTIIFTDTNSVPLLIKNLGLQKDSLSSVFVDLYWNPQGLDNVFVIGEYSKCLDLSEDLLWVDFLYKEQAKVCAYNIFAKINNNPMKLLKSTLQMDFLSLGSRNSLAQIKNFCFEGFLGWFLHRLIYIKCFLGFRKGVTSLIGLLLNLIGLKETILFDISEFNKEKQLVRK